MVGVIATEGIPQAGKAGGSSSDCPLEVEIGAPEGLLASALKVLQELKGQLEECQAYAGCLKLERDDLRELLNKAVAKRDWLLAFSKQSLENEASSCDTAVINAQRLIRSIAKLKLQLAAEKSLCAQLTADLCAEKLCQQVSKLGGNRRSKAPAKQGKGTQTLTADASTCVDTVSGGLTRWGDLFERDDQSFELLP
jgi:septal ring factor EnvC (AmiA/AmiB activator)